MPTKSGSIVYMEDGSNAYQTYSANGLDQNSILPMDKQAQLKTQIESNTTALGASATYTGASFDTMADGVNYTWLTGFVRADQSGNLAVQQSLDGTNFYSLDQMAVAANSPTKINVDIVARYVRFVYTNGATAQGSFILGAYTTFKG